jgi:nucleotide-binding universal stress UspA family protein
MKIVIGVDDSPHSQAAVRYVKETKWPAGTHCMVLAAAAPQVVAYSLMDAGGVTWLKSAEQAMTRQAEELTARVERELREAGVATEARVVQGDPREAIVDAARDTGADLVVVGSHGRTGVGKLLMGSVATHVVGHAPCSVLVVKLKK